MIDLQPNITFDNHYTLIRQLGRGGFSEVWLAHDSYMDLDVALKIYAPGQGMDEHSIDELRREIKVVFTLNHPNLLTPKYLGVWSGMPYLVLAYCSRGSLTQQIGKLSEQELWHVLHDIAAGLAYLHKNDIVHQDIKPDNILLDESGNYVITDFGISTKARSTLRKSVIGGAVSGGTMAYMGPERFSKQPAPTKASDIWSLGAMMFELITGNVPFGEMGGGMQKGGAEIPEINEPISDKLRQTIESMLALETWDRPTAEQLVQTTADYADNLPTSRTTQRMVPPAPTEPATGESSTGGKKIGLVKIFAWVIVSILCILVPIAAYYLHNNTPASYNNTPTSYHEPSVNTIETAQAEPIVEEDAALVAEPEPVVEETPIVKESSVTTSSSVTNSNTCGKSLNWSLDESSGTLIISGRGAMFDERTASFKKLLYPRETIQSIIIEEGVTTIGTWAFDGCRNLISVTIPNSVKSIGDYAFMDCSSLPSITIPNSVISIGNYAFRGCCSINSITIPNSVTSIGEAAFAFCYRATSLIIGSGITKIEKKAFENCSKLTQVIIPYGVKSIGSSSFMSCDHLSSITIPNSVTSIDDYAFYCCSSLESIIIPNSVQHVGKDVFKYCSSLREIRYPADLDISTAGISSSVKLIPYER